MINKLRLTLAIAAVTLSCSITYAQDKSVTSTTSTTSTTAVSTAPLTAEIKIIDVKVGDGRAAEKGRAALVHYTGWLYDEKAPDNKGKQFDTSSGRGLPFGFILGVGKVIKGWDEGLVGMKIGGKRTLIIPAHLAYGDRDVGGGLIPANSTLVFDVELVDVKP